MAEIDLLVAQNVLSTLVQVTNDACGQQMGKILSSGPEGVAEAQKNLEAFFGGAKGSGPAKPQSQEDADAAEAAAVWKILNGEEDEGEEPEAREEAPSTNRFAGCSAGAGNGWPPLYHGKGSGNVRRPEGAKLPTPSRLREFATRKDQRPPESA